MSMRVATFAASSQMLDAAMRVQARMAEMNLQQASGVKSTDYGGLGRDSKTLIKLETLMSRSKAYSTSIKEASNRIEVMYTSLTSVTDLLSDFRAQITANLSGDADAVSATVLTSAAAAYVDELASILNTQYEGRHLFAGSLTETKPIDLTGYIADISTKSTDYYKGDDIPASVKASSEVTLTYGVTADDSAFEQAIRGLSVLGQSTETPDSDMLKAVYNLLSSALNETTALVSGLSVTSTTLDRMQVQQDRYQNILTANISNVRDVDIAELTVKLKIYDTQLSASYSSLAKIMSINLQDYLR